jgi:hypothetical protein
MDTLNSNLHSNTYFFKLVGSKYSFALLLVLGEQNYYTRVDMLKYDYMTFFFEPGSFPPHSHAFARKYGGCRVLNPGWPSARLIEPVLLTKRALAQNSLLKITCIQNPYSIEHGGETT